MFENCFSIILNLNLIFVDVLLNFPGKTLDCCLVFAITYKLLAYSATFSLKIFGCSKRIVRLSSKDSNKNQW